MVFMEKEKYMGQKYAKTNRRYPFVISRRFLIGLLYSVTFISILLPSWHVSKYVERAAKMFSIGLEESLIILTFGLAIWVSVNIVLLFKFRKYLDEKRSQKQFEELKAFQQETLSLMDIEALCQRILETLPNLIKDVDIFIALQKEAGSYDIIGSTEGFSLTEEENIKAIEEVEDSVRGGYIGISPLKYDDVLMGYLCLRPKEKLRMNYQDVKCFQQFADHVSLCLKNISIYQKRYQLTIHDDLTGLYNRRYFKEFMEKNWAEGKEQAFLYLDIDDFRLFNELYGGACGDEILNWCGQAIAASVGRDGEVFHFASDEYVVYLCGKTREELLGIADKIQRTLRQKHMEKSASMQPVTMSIGISMYSSGAFGAGEVLKQAENAALFVKQHGKNGVAEFGTATEEYRENRKSKGAYKQISSTVYAWIAAINAKYPYASRHSRQVAQYAAILAKEIGLTSHEIRVIKEAALLHDIGEIGIPGYILNKKGKLTAEEYEIVKGHVATSVEMIHFLPNMNYVIPAVLSHHERYDGKGYPRGLAGKEIPLSGRILAVCDAYQAMVSKRPYKEAISQEDAVSELRNNKGTQFDPALADVLISLIPTLDTAFIDCE